MRYLTETDNCCRRARRVLDLHKPKQEKTLPRLLSDSDLKRFFKVIQDCGVLQHEIMLKLLFYTAVRVSELVHIRVADVDTAQCKIFIDQGKGSKDRYILFPKASAWSCAVTSKPIRGTATCSNLDITGSLLGTGKIAR